MANPYPEDVISSWSTLIENLKASPLDFYESVKSAIRKRDIPETEMSQVDFYESGLFSHKREYLRIIRGKLLFDICAAPYGNAFFVSWWLGAKQPFILRIPVIGWLYGRFIKPPTYYSLDTTKMFRTATHAAILEAVDGLTTAKGLRALSESERKPTLRDVLN